MEEVDSGAEVRVKIGSQQAECSARVQESSDTEEDIMLEHHIERDFSLGNGLSIMVDDFDVVDYAPRNERDIHTITVLAFFEDPGLEQALKTLL